MFKFPKHNSKHHLLSSSALMGGVLLIGLQAAPLQAAQCAGAMNAGNTTTCPGMLNNVSMFYPGDSPSFMAGSDFNLNLIGTQTNNAEINVNMMGADGVTVVGKDVNLLNTAGSALSTATLVGNISIGINGSSTLSGNPNGFSAISAGITGGAGNVVIGVDGATTISGQGAGIGGGTNGTGTVTITANNTGGITSSKDFGIFAQSTTGLITIVGSAVVTAANFGVGAATTDGNITITYSGTVSAGSTGIAAGSKNGDLKITTRAVTGGTDGIIATTNGDGTIDVTTNGPVIGTANNGIFTSSGSGLTTITTNRTVTGGVNGINANASTGDITITANDDVTGTTGDGIEANGKAGDLQITTKATILGALDGIAASTALAGTIDVTTNGGTITGTGGTGISTIAETGPTTIINKGAIVQGGSSGISAVSNLGGTISIQNKLGGIIRNLSGVDSDFAIVATGTGAVTIVNDGTILGRLKLGVGKDIFNQNNVWVTEGSSDFGAGNDVLNGAGTILVGDEAGVVETSFFNNLETFNNSGTIALSDEAAGNGSTTFDTLTVSGNYVGLGGTLLVDAFLAGPGSQADRLIVNGDTSGSTAITVVDTNPGQGAFNQDGIIIVQVGGNANASDFTLAGGPITKGMFVYSLVFDAANKDFELVSAPGQVVIDGGGIPSGGQSVWYDTMGAWEGREADLCAPPQGRLPTRGTQGLATQTRARFVCPDRQGGIWAKALGGWTDRDGDTDLGQSYVQRTFGFVGGIDQAMAVGENGHLLLGLMGGYVHSLQDFRLSPTTVTYEGGVLGGYATYKDGPFSLHGLVNANLLDADYSNPALGVDGKASADVLNIGARVDAAYRFQGLGTGMFLEPIASVVAMTSDIGNFKLGTVTFHPGDNDSVRAGIGARVGAKMDMDTIIVETSLTGRLWNEFAAQNTLHVTTAVDPLDIQDDGLHGLMGEVNAALNVSFADTATSYFIKTDLRFKDQITSGGLSAGLRFIW